jgi:hypothetical protein
VSFPSGLPFRRHSSPPLSLARSHVRPPPTPPPPHASPPAPHRAHIHVPPATRTSLPLTPSANMLPRAEIPTEHVASPSNTVSNNRANHFYLSSTLPLSHLTSTFPCSLPPTICTARDDMTFSRFRTGIRSTPFRHFLLTPFEHLAWFIGLLLHCTITILKHLIRYTLYTIPRLLYSSIIRNASSVALPFFKLFPVCL